MPTRSPDDFQERMRLDFKLEAVVDPTTGKKGIISALDPARYKIVGGTDEPMVHDELDDFYIPLKEAQRMIEHALMTRPTGEGQRQRLPIYP